MYNYACVVPSYNYRSTTYSLYIPVYTELFNYEDTLVAGGYPKFGGLKGRSRPKQDPPIERDLLLTLEEVYNGCIKKMEISRKVSLMVFIGARFINTKHVHTCTCLCIPFVIIMLIIVC